MYVLVVDAFAKPGQAEAFQKASLEDAKGSTQNEPGCLRFDVYQDQADPSHFTFVEVYKDEAALQAHTKTPHFAAWRAATKDLTAQPLKVVRAHNAFPADKDWK